jgi:hypothetical protein
MYTKYPAMEDFLILGGVFSPRPNAGSVPKIYLLLMQSSPKINFKIFLRNTSFPNVIKCCPPNTNSYQKRNLFPLLHAHSCQLIITPPSSVLNSVRVYSLCLPEERAITNWRFLDNKFFSIPSNNKKCVALTNPSQPSVSSLYLLLCHGP